MTGGIAASVALFFFAGLAAFALAITAFWIWMPVDCATNDRLQGNDKVVWVPIVIFTGLIGAIIYFFVERPEKNQPPVSSSPPGPTVPPPIFGGTR